MSQPQASAKFSPQERRKASRTESKDRRTRERVAPGYGSRRGKKLIDGMTKAELIEKYRYKVRVIAMKMARDLPACVDHEDLFSMGFMGLLDAADKFDPSKGARFDTYAEFRIRGAIIDELRKQDWVPRSARDRLNAIQTVADQIESRTGQKATESEISQVMKMPLGKFQEMLQNLGNQTLVNLEDLPDMHEREDSEATDPFREVVRKEARAVIEKLLQLLPEQDQMVLKLYYYRGLNLREISSIMGVTESRVSQIHSRAVMALKANARGEVPAVESVFLGLMD